MAILDGRGDEAQLRDEILLDPVLICRMEHGYGDRKDKNERQEYGKEYSLEYLLIHRDL